MDSSSIYARGGSQDLWKGNGGRRRKHKPGTPLSAELWGLGNLSFPLPAHPHPNASHTAACLPSVPGRVPYGPSPGTVQAGCCGR